MLLTIPADTVKHAFFRGMFFFFLRFGLHGHFCSTLFSQNSETAEMIFVILSCSDP